jgi:toxin ParE1/3/4
MVQIRWTVLSVEDLNEIFDYISRDSLTYAKIQIIKLRARTKILKTNPQAGKIVAEFSDDSFRELIEGSYRIIYKIVDSKRIDILTIHHSSRDLIRRQIE